MPIKLQQEHIKLSEVICSRFCQTTAECDIIVPDIKPDVLKVLRSSCEAAITEKSVQTDKVHLGGTIRIDILYIPDGNVIGKVKSISTVHPFNHTIDVKGAKPGMNLIADAECELPEHTLVNSRKLNLRTVVGMNIKVTAETEIDIATAVDSAEPIQTRCEHLKIFNSCCEAERDFSVRERLDVPSGKPDLGEVLKLSVKPVSEELRLLDNKAIIKGELLVSTLYCDNGEESTVHCMEHSVPFTEILEIDGIRENMDGEIDYCVKDVSCEICCDTDGDKRILSIEIMLCAIVRATEVIECDALCDAYSLKGELSTRTAQYNLEQLISNASAQITEKEQISVPDYLPELHQIFDCSTIPNIENITTEKDSATVNGYITCNILYMSSDTENPVSGFTHIIPFSHRFDIAGINENTVCDAKADTEHTSYTISGGRSIEVRPSISLTLKAVSPQHCEFINQVECDDEAQVPQIPSVVVYFIRPGDTLWDIAKRFRTTPEQLLENNNVDPENLQIGSPVYIFR
ncbi:MAG: DUF3794 domain-containing protein [Clostridia bacterium]|nr:DUF3794 domain-containing protein [Clostridia bacterium]